MFRLAHISDVHLGPLPDVTYRDLASKRVVGYVNWQRNRRRHHHDGIVDAIVADLKAQVPDHLAVTGDLVNLALDGEIELARLWLQTLGAPTDVSVVPGNHDAYVPGAFDKACHAWAPWMSGDGSHGPVRRTSFPYLRIRPNVALIGVSTARATAPFMASGFFREGQAERLAGILEETGKRDLFRVVMIHHPPVRGAVGQHKRLLGIGKFQKVIRQSGAELVLHGHSHLPTLHWIEGHTGMVPVVGVAAAGQAAGGLRPAAQFNLLDISGERGNWNVQLTRRGLSVPAAPPSEVSTIDLTAIAPHRALLVRS
ncbi:metallophosphoesterase [Aminobacter sp. AP02]|uniref:metallophosphoesterase family protein n=1 Tax=Aminobacter sp. AP02 TaxID=2135737 RepID=UPI000D6C817D|nr:metallophosphoesterase [Aminobacter sp. AP02]PWK71518.1 3',5'-cyclic AMP phosphodiesterase CpdA [Aminobacter sp. AP02]